MAAHEDITTLAEMLYNELAESPGVGGVISVDSVVDRCHSQIRQIYGGEILDFNAGDVVHRLEANRFLQRKKAEYLVQSHQGSFEERHFGQGIFA